METEAAEACPCYEGTPQRPAMSRGPDGCREIVRTCDLCGRTGSSRQKRRRGTGEAMRCASIACVNCLTLKWLAELLGTSPVVLNQVEHWQANPPDQQWRRFEELSHTLA
jgi:hypothetical protein